MEDYEDCEESRRTVVWGAARFPALVQPRAEELQGDLMAAAAPRREQRGSSACWWQWQDTREWYGNVSGHGQVRIREKIIHQSVARHWNSGHGSELLEFKTNLDNTFRDMVWFLWSKEWNSMILVGPFQHGTWYDSILWSPASTNPAASVSPYMGAYMLQPPSHLSGS